MSPTPPLPHSFGLAGNIPSSTATTTGLQTWVTAAGAPWGADLNGVAVSNLATFTAAVSQLRSYAGHTPGIMAWANPPRWPAFDMMMSSSVGGPTGNSMAAQVAGLQANGITPLLVFWLSCTVFQFSTLDVSKATYWAECAEGSPFSSHLAAVLPRSPAETRRSPSH